MAKLYNISSWNEQLWWNTGGTRDKKIYLNPADNELYFFKQSFKKGQRDYKHEFWSEIIASEVGALLGFNILTYDIALRGEIVGCISKSMIMQASEELIEIGKYLQAYDNTFNPENIKLRNRYNFELITNALVAFKKEKHFVDLAETIVFDSLIGNSDRHQENWAIINVHSIFSESVKQLEKEIVSGEIESLPSWMKKMFKSIYMVKGNLRPEIKNARLMLPNQTRFAPIYDSGCSFGRELDDERVLRMIKDNQEIVKYVNKGLAEIHWGNEKLNHFELIKMLLISEGFRDFVLSTLEKVVKKFDTDQIELIVLNIDNEIHKVGNQNLLPKERKELILKILTLRFNKLKEIYSKYK